MLEGMRRHASWIILVVAAVFILSMAIGGISSIFVENPYKYVGVIEDRKLTYDEYKELLSTTYANFAQENPDAEFDDKIAEELNEKTWNNLLQVTLFDKEIKKRRIKLREDDIIDKLQNPADDIKAIEQFHTDGVFDIEKYRTMLFENEDFASYMENRIRGMLPYDMLYDDVKSEVEFTHEDLEEDYIKDNTKADADIIHFDLKLVPEVEVTPEDMQKYYEENIEDFKKGPARKLKFARILLEPSEADRAAVKTKIDSLHQVIISGEDFAEIAREFSEDTSAQSGGDLGYFNAGKMVQEFNDAAFSMNIGDISDPVKTEYGWHIINCTGKQTGEDGLPQVRASHILIKFAASEATKQNLEILANDLYDRIKEDGIDIAAEDLAYTVQETAEFYEDSKYVPSIGKDEGQVAFAFQNKVGKVLEPAMQPNESYIVAQISFKIGDHYQEFADVEAKVKRTVQQEMRLTAVIEIAEKFVADHTPETYLEAAEAEDIAIVDGKGVTIDSAIPSIRKDVVLNETIMTLQAGENSDLIKGEFAAYIAFVTNREDPDMEKFEIEKDTMYETTLETKKNEYLNTWYKELIDNANIVDNRKLFFN